MRGGNCFCEHYRIRPIRGTLAASSIAFLPEPRSRGWTRTSEASTYTLGYLVERLRKTLLGRSARRPARWPGSGLRIGVNLFDVVTVQAVLRARA